MTGPAGPVRNLLIVRAGDRSLHEQWLRPANDRSFDVAVHYYGKQTGKWSGAATLYTYLPGLKWPCLADWIDANWDVVSRYDYIGFPDDDLGADATTWSKVFQAMSDLGLHLAQPALSESSYWSHPLTVQDKQCRARYTNFVEVMSPVFSLRGLEVCLPTFRLSPSGWGLDWVWPKVLRQEGLAVGIVDEVSVEHTRAVSTASATNQADKTALCNILPHPALLDESLLKEIFGLTSAPDPTVYSVVPKAVLAGVPRPVNPRPVSFVTCLAGLDLDCEIAIEAIAGAMRTGDEAIIVTTSNGSLPSRCAVLNTSVAVKRVNITWGADLTSQYHAAVLTASQDQVVIVTPGSRFSRADIDDMRALLRDERVGVVALQVGAEAPLPTVIAARRAALETGGGFPGARDSFINPNGAIGAIGSRELLGRMAKRAEDGGWHLVRTAALAHGAAPGLLGTAVPDGGVGGERPPVIGEDEGPRSKRCPPGVRTALAHDATKLALFSWPFMTPDQRQLLASWFAPAIEGHFTAEDWMSLAGDLSSGGHLGYVAFLLATADLGQLANLEVAAAILVTAGAPISWVADKLAHAPRALETCIAAQPTERALELLEQWWACQPAAAAECAASIAERLPAGQRQLWQDRRLQSVRHGGLVTSPA